MPRLMSVAYTEDAVRARIKTVTRRAGWSYLSPGDRLTLCRKVMGRRKGEPLVRVAEVQVIDVRRERLDRMLTDPDYGAAEVALEGFPDLTPQAFVLRYFIDAQGIAPEALVTRVEWEYVDPDPTLPLGVG